MTPSPAPASTAATVPRFNVLGVDVHALTLPLATELVLSSHGPTRRGYVCVTGVHGVIECQDDPALREIYRRAWLVTPDGMPMVWLGPRGTTRVYGPDLMLSVCDAGRAIGLTHYLYGGADGVAPLLRRRLEARFPGIQILGTHTPPYRPLTADEFSAWQQEIATLRPDVIWVGLGTPKQERFMARAWPQLDCGTLIGVGAAFDFHTGRVAQAPRWMQRSGLEWFFRLTQEPRRLAGRYFRTNPRFVALLLLQKLGLRRFN